MYTRDTRDVTVEVVDTSTEGDRVLDFNSTAVWDGLRLFVYDLGLDAGLTDFALVEDGIFWDGDAVECAVDKDAALAELGVGLPLVEDKGAVDKDAAVGELEKVDKGGAVKDGAVWEAATRSELTAFFDVALRACVPFCFLIEHVIMGRGLSVPFVVKFVTHCVTLLECVKYRLL